MHIISTSVCVFIRPGCQWAPSEEQDHHQETADVQEWWQGHQVRGESRRGGREGRREGRGGRGEGGEGREREGAGEGGGGRGRHVYPLPLML